MLNCLENRNLVYFRKNKNKQSHNTTFSDKVRNHNFFTRLVIPPLFQHCTIFSKLYHVFFSLLVSVSLEVTFPSHSFGDCSTGCIRSLSWKIAPSISLQFSSLTLTVILLLLITFLPSSEDLLKNISHVLFIPEIPQITVLSALGWYPNSLLGMT